MSKAKVQMVQLDSLTPNPRNPRMMRPEAMEKLKDSIQRDPEFMPLRPIIYDEQRMILGGNQRYRACLELGMIEIPESWAREASGLSTEQRQRFVLIDNAPEGMAGFWDWDFLTEDWQLPELAELGFTIHEGMVQDDPSQVWQGMPEYHVEDQSPWRSLIVHFRNQEDLTSFCELVGQKVTDKTKFLWHPKAEIERYTDKEFVDES